MTEHPTHVHQATCGLCGAEGIHVDPELRPQPRLVAHLMPDGTSTCFRGAPGQNMTVIGDCDMTVAGICKEDALAVELCCGGDQPRTGCQRCLSKLYEQITGRNPPPDDSYSGWYNEYVNTGSELAKNKMEAAKLPPLPTPEDELTELERRPDRRPGEQVPPKHHHHMPFTLMLAVASVMTAVLGPAGTFSAVFSGISLFLILFTLIRWM